MALAAVGIALTSAVVSQAPASVLACPSVGCTEPGPDGVEPS
ncbi:hypothetical protein SAMN05421504_11190 [Amycolatopsis xylanica]|uniref:Uncharacterized protein n=2 Tax=Amycolatopsis xylanica TaxID=589385 RepID=A0A1H3RHD0_9PSEU|nr:hypothetical protein SAMN05421504_11190 [Amycolatopsis xylanica]